MIVCDFCEKTQKEVRKLVASRNDVHICDECILVCVYIIAKKVDSSDSEMAAMPATEVTR